MKEIRGLVGRPAEGELSDWLLLDTPPGREGAGVGFDTLDARNIKFSCLEPTSWSFYIYTVSQQKRPLLFKCSTVLMSTNEVFGVRRLDANAASRRGCLARIIY